RRPCGPGRGRRPGRRPPRPDDGPAPSGTRSTPGGRAAAPAPRTRPRPPRRRTAPAAPHRVVAAPPAGADGVTRRVTALRPGPCPSVGVMALPSIVQADGPGRATYFALPPGPGLRSVSLRGGT